MIASLLIANRGEIACRIIRTARRLGISTVAVYSDADADALHVRMADRAVHIGPSPARESYLVGERIIAAARETGAEAIHPGYGFLSENAEFAEAVAAAGLVWVGPSPHSIRAMGLKDAAKKLMSEAGVPVTPGYMGEDQSADVLATRAGETGYPVLIKAVAGGGGKGMRLVEQAADFADALASCRREAAASFGNDHVLIEKFVQRPRHIEVQVFGDTHGNVVHLFERDCSLQRRHQKVIEEAPAPGMDDATREAICAAAVRAAKAVDYVGAGTIEFIADGSEGLRADRIWFMEMNTRLQVEHPVTEAITGVDLVEWQLRVASGERLPKTQDELSISGWAMEARLYAEDPAKGFLPSIGTLDHFSLPENSPGGFMRIDSGVEEGDEISPFYDPMIAKVICEGRRRSSAANLLAEALAGALIGPIKTNAGFLVRCLRHDRFLSGEVDTGFIERYSDELIGSGEPASSAIDVAALCFLYLEADYEEPFRFRRCQKIVAPGHYAGSIWKTLAGFRNSRPSRIQFEIECDGRSYLVDQVPGEIGTGAHFVEATGDEVLVGGEGDTYVFRLDRKYGVAGGALASGSILAPMPGKVIAVEVAAGDRVAKGQKLLTLEAMKMEHSLTAPFDGVVAELNATAGAQVQVEALLARIDADGE